MSTLQDIRNLQEWFRLRKLGQNQDQGVIPSGGIETPPTSITPTPPDILKSDSELGSYDDNSTEGYKYGELSPRNPEGGNSLKELMDRLSDIYTPETVDRDRFRRLLDSFPQREDPSTARKLVASAMGWSASRKRGGDPIKTMEEVMYAPYMRDLEAWKAKTTPYQQAMIAENTANVNERNIARDVLNTQTAYQKLAQQEQDAADRNEIAKLRIAAQQAIAQGRNIQWDVTGPTVLMREGNTVRDTGVKTGKMTEFDKISLQNQGRNQAAEIAATSRENVAADQGTPFNLPNPDDPNKPGTSVVVRTRGPNMGQATPITQDGAPVGPLQRPGSGAAGKLVQPTNLKEIQGNTQEVINLIGKLLDDKDQLTPIAKSYYGRGALIGLEHLPLGDARTAANYHNQLKSSRIIDLIGQMKTQSRTGATGFGQLSRAELQVLDRSANNLDPLQDPEITRQELARIREKLKKVLLPTDGTTPTETQPRTDLQQAIDKALGLP